MCKILGIHKTRTTPYRPQSDGMIERANCTIENMLSLFVDENQKNWDQMIPLLMLAYRSSIHETTGVSPHEMMIARPATLPVDLVLGRLEPTIEQSGIDYTKTLREKLDIIHKFAGNKMTYNTDKMLRDYNNRYNTMFTNLEIQCGFTTQTPNQGFQKNFLEIGRVPILCLRR